jgi:hypothetical protein
MSALAADTVSSPDTDQTAAQKIASRDIHIPNEIRQTAPTRESFFFTEYARRSEQGRVDIESMIAAGALKSNRVIISGIRGSPQIIGDLLASAMCAKTHVAATNAENIPMGRRVPPNKMIIPRIIA